MKDLEENKSAFYELNLASINCFLSMKKIADHAANSIVFLNVLLFFAEYGSRIINQSSNSQVEKPKKVGSWNPTSNKSIFFKMEVGNPTNPTPEMEVGF